MASSSASLAAGSTANAPLRSFTIFNPTLSRGNEEKAMDNIIYYYPSSHDNNKQMNRVGFCVACACICERFALRNDQMELCDEIQTDGSISVLFSPMREVWVAAEVDPSIDTLSVRLLLEKAVSAFLLLNGPDVLLIEPPPHKRYVMGSDAAYEERLRQSGIRKRKIEGFFRDFTTYLVTYALVKVTEAGPFYDYRFRTAADVLMALPTTIPSLDAASYVRFDGLCTRFMPYLTAHDDIIRRSLLGSNAANTTTTAAIGTVSNPVSPTNAADSSFVSPQSGTCGAALQFVVGFIDDGRLLYSSAPGDMSHKLLFLARTQLPLLEHHYRKQANVIHVSANVVRPMMFSQRYGFAVFVLGEEMSTTAYDELMKARAATLGGGEGGRSSNAGTSSPPATVGTPATPKDGAALHFPSNADGLNDSPAAPSTPTDATPTTTTTTSMAAPEGSATAPPSSSMPLLDTFAVVDRIAKHRPALVSDLLTCVELIATQSYARACELRAVHLTTEAKKIGQAIRVSVARQQQQQAAAKAAASNSNNGGGPAKWLDVLQLSLAGPAGVSVANSILAPSPVALMSCLPDGPIAYTHRAALTRMAPAAAQPAAVPKCSEVHPTLVCFNRGFAYGSPLASLPRMAQLAIAHYMSEVWRNHYAAMPFTEHDFLYENTMGLTEAPMATAGGWVGDYAADGIDDATINHFNQHYRHKLIDAVNMIRFQGRVGTVTDCASSSSSTATFAKLPAITSPTLLVDGDKDVGEVWVPILVKPMNANTTINVNGASSAAGGGGGSSSSNSGGTSSSAANTTSANSSAAPLPADALSEEAYGVALLAIAQFNGRVVAIYFPPRNRLSFVEQMASATNLFTAAFRGSGFV